MTTKYRSSDNGIGDRPSWAKPKYQLIGVDAEGSDHLLQNDDQIVYVVDEDEVVERYDLQEVDKNLTDWRNFVADRRGWDEFFLTLIDSREIFGAVERHTTGGQ